MEGLFPVMPDVHAVLDEARDPVADGAVASADDVWATGESGSPIVVGYGRHVLPGKVSGADLATDVRKHAGINVEAVD